MADVCACRFEGLEELRVVRLLVIDGGFLEALTQVDAVQAELSGEVGACLEDACPVEGLAVEELPQFEQEGLARQVVEPVDGLQVVAAAALAPEGPMAQWRLGQLLELVAEVAGHELQDALVARGAVVLLHDFQDDHLGPPVVRVVALQSGLVGSVGIGAEVARLLL